jgi:hypothetical protein
MEVPMTRLRSRSSLVLPLALSLSLGCPGEPSDADAGPPAPDKDDLVEAYVDVFLRCSEWGPDSFLSELEPDVAEDFRRRFDDTLTERVREVLDSPNVELHEDRIAGCVAFLEAAECGEEPLEGECEDVVTGTIEDDGPCLDDSECASGFCHQPDDAECGTCEPVGGDGDACRELSDVTMEVETLRCEEDLYCNFVSEECEPKLGQGALCVSSGQCQQDHYCVGFPAQCDAIAFGEEAGDTCFVTDQAQTCGGVLVAGLRCEGAANTDGVCVAIAIVAENGTCDGQIGEDAALWCERGLTQNYCVIPDGANVGVCGPLPAAGDSCVQSTGRCRNDALCVLLDPNPLDRQAECVPAPAEGDACVEDALGSDGCSTIGGFLECDDDETEPTCVAVIFGEEDVEATCE